jgi:hypothetical protein
MNSNSIDFKRNNRYVQYFKTLSALHHVFGGISTSNQFAALQIEWSFNVANDIVFGHFKFNFCAKLVQWYLVINEHSFIKNRFLKSNGSY